jgi:hypothetical protein
LPVKRQRVDVTVFVPILLILFWGFNALRDRAAEARAPSPAGDPVSAGQLSAATGGAAHDVSPFAGIEDQEEIAAPYAQYVLTQGLHGFSYGHLAIDISAGQGAAVLSPIHGVVTELYVDDLGNTTLVIENEIYRVELLHGLYSVALGDRVALGQPIGTESNQGNTYDSAGRSCRGRDCGYHTHLNIYDKRIGANLDPMQALEK